MTLVGFIRVSFVLQGLSLIRVVEWLQRVLIRVASSSDPVESCQLKDCLILTGWHCALFYNSSFLFLIKHTINELSVKVRDDSIVFELWECFLDKLSLIFVSLVICQRWKFGKFAFLKACDFAYYVLIFLTWFTVYIWLTRWGRWCRIDGASMLVLE